MKCTLTLENTFVRWKCRPSPIQEAGVALRPHRKIGVGCANDVPDLELGWLPFQVGGTRGRNVTVRAAQSAGADDSQNQYLIVGSEIQSRVP